MTSQIRVLVSSLASTTSPPSSIFMLFIHGQWSNQVVSAECVRNRLLHESTFNVPSGVTIIFLGERLRSRRASYLPLCIVLPRSRCRSAVRFPRLQALSYMHRRSAPSARSESNPWPRSEETAQLPGTRPKCKVQTTIDTVWQKPTPTP
jgi:hypothetical protein